MIYSNKHNICFLRIPKTGSESLFSFLITNLYDTNADIISRKIEKLDNDEIVWGENNPLVENSHVGADYLIKNNIVPKNCEFVGVIRNPYEKILSVYFAKVNIQKFKSSEEFISYFRYIIKGGKLSISIKKYDEYIQEYHIIPQSSFFKHEGKYVEKYRMLLFDNIEKELSCYLKEKNINIDVKFPHINRTKYKTKQLIDIFYTDEIKEKVKEVYREDFKIYSDLKENICDDV